MIAITSLAAECAPMVAPSTMAAIVQVESGGDPLAMWNNAKHQEEQPPNRAATIAIS
jgi:type IV secretion system protein VirB1